MTSPELDKAEAVTLFDWLRALPGYLPGTWLHEQIEAISSELAASRERERALERERDAYEKGCEEWQADAANLAGECTQLKARAEAAEAEVKRLRATIVEAIAKANERLPGIETPVMRSDNLAIVLCSAFDDGDRETEDDTGWSEAARTGYEEVIAAIREHYLSAIRALADANTQGGGNG